MSDGGKYQLPEKESKVVVSGGPKVDVNISCHRCRGDVKCSPQFIGNGMYCPDCAEDIWANVG